MTAVSVPVFTEAHFLRSLLLMLAGFLPLHALAADVSLFEIDALRGETSDAAWIIDRCAAVAGDEFTREKTFDLLDVPFRLEPGPGGPARGLDAIPVPEVAFQTRPLSRGRPFEIHPESPASRVIQTRMKKGARGKWPPPRGVAVR